MIETSTIMQRCLTKMLMSIDLRMALQVLYESAETVGY